MTHDVAFSRRGGVTVIALALASAAFLTFAHVAGAAIVTNVPMGTAAAYSVQSGWLSASASTPAAAPTRMPAPPTRLANARWSCSG